VDGTLAEHELLLDVMIAGLEVSSKLRLDVLGREDWDLFACGLAEYQCAGHHFWDFEHDPDHPRLHGALRDVYARLDETLRMVLDAAGSDDGHGAGQPRPRATHRRRTAAARVLARLGMASRKCRRVCPAPDPFFRLEPARSPSPRRA
jgi:hypothetical protein